jgi:hypothetical protein
VTVVLFILCVDLGLPFLHFLNMLGPGSSLVI